MDVSFVFLPLIAISGLVGLACFLFWVGMLADAVANESSTGNDRLVWVLVILLAQFFGAVIYYLVRRPERIAALGR